MTTMTREIQAKSLDVPDETQPIPGKGQFEVVHLGETTAARATFQPGFRWSEHVGQDVGASLCPVRHIGYVISGRSGIRMADGTERELAAGDAFDVPAGHDAWVIGDEPYVTINFSPAEESAPRPEGQDGWLLAKDHTILLENDRVRVLELKQGPGQTTGMHSHPPCVVYALSSSRAKFSFPDGTSREVEIHNGDVNWSEGGSHEVENIGATKDWGIIVELKA